MQDVTSATPRSRFSRLSTLPIVRLSLVSAAGFFLWHALFAVLAADRGLDLTDEGLYLLAAQPPSFELTWETPWGWHTGPLFRAVGYDVAAFRTLGAFLFVAASGALGLAAVRVGGLVRNPENSTASSVERIFGATTGGLAGFLYYGGMLRTPSYNWVTVIGATVAALGLLQIVASRLSARCDSSGGTPWPSRWPPSPHAWGVLIAGFGVFFTVPPKPTTPIFFALLAIPVLGLVGDRRFVLRTLLQITMAAAGFLAAAVVVGLWPVRFATAFLDAVAAPSILPEHSLLGALLTLPRFLLDLLEDARSLTAFLLALTFLLLSVGQSRSSRVGRLIERRSFLVGSALIVVGILALGWLTVSPLVRFVHALPADGWTSLVMGGRATHPAEMYIAAARGVLERSAWIVAGTTGGLLLLSFPARWRTAVVVLVTIGLLRVDQPISMVALNGATQTQFVRAELTHGTFILGAGLLLLGANAWSNPSEARVVSPSRRSRDARLVLAIIALYLFGVSTGFGSGHGLLRQAALAAGVLVAALLVGASGFRSGRDRLLAYTLVVALVLPTTVTYLVSNLWAPYRTEPMAVQIVPTQVGVDGATLRLDHDLAQLLDGITEAAVAEGWEPGTPLIAVSSRWASTLPWHLGGTVPDSLMLTLGGSGERSEARLDFNLARHVDDRFENAWIIVTAERHERREESLRWAERSVARFGRNFPNDYRLVFVSGPASSRWVNEYGAVELWRPKYP